MILAITGGTGFVGGHLIDRALAAGHQVRALTRRPQPARTGITWITGDLATPGSLAQGADAVIHVAGIVNAPDRAGFVAGNVEGTRAILAAAASSGVRRFVHVSSLSAREPQLSDYGWSKREAERLVEASALDWTIVRPTAIYGAGDMEMRDLFRAARLGLALLPPPGLMSAVEVGDLARLLLILAERPGACETYEIDDGRAWTHVEFAEALGAAVGRPVLAMHLPKPLMQLGARLDRLIRGDKAKLTPDRVGYLCHSDWSAASDRRPPAELWAPLVDTSTGLAATARWYRANGLL